MDEGYADGLIRIQPWDEAMGAYPVEATLDDGSFFDGGELRLDQEKLLANQNDALAYGVALFDALLVGPIVNRPAWD